MQKIIIFAAVLVSARAAPAYLLAEESHYVLPHAKSTITSSSQTVDHGSTHVIHPLPVVHATPLVHVPMAISSQSHESTLYHAPASKTTITNSKHAVNHGSTALVHAPVVSLTHSSPLVYHSPLVTYKSPDTVISHLSSVHQTVPVFNSLPLYTLR